MDRKLFILLFLIFLFIFGSVLGLSSKAKEGKSFLIIYRTEEAGEKKTYKIHFSKEKDFQQKLAGLKNDPKISEIESGEPFKVLTTPNDTYYQNQWALIKISAPLAWELTTGSASNTIAFVDTGLDYDHQDLDEKIWTNPGETVNGRDDDENGYVDDTKGWDFVDNDNDPKEEAGLESGHGTAVAGIAVATTNNSQGIAGIDWQAKAMILRAMSPDGTGDPDDVANAIKYAADNGAKIINLSIGSQTDWSVVRNAVDYAWNKGSLLVGASGNDGAASIVYPAGYSNVIAVGSSNSSDTRSSFSNYGPQIDVVAPGENIYTTYWQQGYLNSYATVSGTSASTPLVSGLASLVWAKYPSFSNSQIIEKIIKNTDKVGNMGVNNFTNEYGYGRVNAFQSLCRLIKSSGPKVYLIDRSVRYHIPNPTTFYNFGFSWEQIVFSPETLIGITPYGGQLNNLIKGSGAEIYALDRGVKRHIESMASFNAWQFKWETLSFLSDNFISTIPSSNFISQLAKSPNNPKVYLIENGKRRWITSMNVFKKKGYRWEFVGIVSDGLLNSKPQGADVK